MAVRPFVCPGICISLPLLLALPILLMYITFDEIFNSQVNANLKLVPNEDGSFGQALEAWAKPPVKLDFNFYFFNVTNPDRVTYFGEKPILVQVGPYTFKEHEEKRNITFSKDHEWVTYHNYRTWTFDLERSCAVCTYEDKVIIPNPVYAGIAVQLLHESAGWKWLANVLSLASGTYPFRLIPIKGVLYEGYEDPLFEAFNHPVTQSLLRILDLVNISLPFKLPNIRKMGFFVDYNNSHDGEYHIHTGKSNMADLGKIIKWEHHDRLPDDWWTTPQALMLNGSDGSFYPPNLSENDEPPVYISYVCRSMHLKYEKDVEHAGVMTRRFILPADVFDTTLPENAGFKFNLNPVRFYKNQPNDTLPKGLLKLACLPGKRETSPVPAIFSLPHFLGSTQEVVDSLTGMEPDPEKHGLGHYDLEKKSSAAMDVVFRLQISFPLFNDPTLVMLRNMPNVIIPFMWLETPAQLEQSFLTQLRLLFGVVPVVFPWVLVAMLVILAVVMLLGCRNCWATARAQRTDQRKRKVYTTDDTLGHWPEVYLPEDDKEEKIPRPQLDELKANRGQQNGPSIPRNKNTLSDTAWKLPANYLSEEINSNGREKRSSKRLRRVM